jgi:membrane protease YdiL (CAAX protease family)
MAVDSPDHHASGVWVCSPGNSNILGGVKFTAQGARILFWLLVIRIVVGRDWPRIVGLRRPGGEHLAIVLLSFPAMVVLGNALYGALKYVLPSITELWDIPGMEEMVKLFNSWPWFFAVLVIGLGPGISEELWCRAFLGRGLVGHYGVVLGVLYASFFFGLIHIDPLQGTMAMFVGAWLHFVYLTTRSLWMPMLLHFLNNSLAVVANRSESLTKMEGQVQGNQVLIVLTSLALLVSAGWALYRSRVRLEPAEDVGADWTPEYGGVAHPPSQSTRAVIRPFPGWLALSLCAGWCAGLLAVLLLHGG